MTTTTLPRAAGPVGDEQRPTDEDDLQRINRTAAALGLYALAFGVSFGAVASGAGLTLAQVVVLSLVMCSGASQFAFVGILASGGSAPAAALAAVVLGLRNAFYGPSLRDRIPIARRWSPLVAVMVLDETAAVALAEPTDRTARLAFRRTAAVLFVAWLAGSTIGALLGDVLDPAALGLDAAVPVVFVALLWPMLQRGRARTVAGVAIVTTAVLVPVAPAGVPVLVAAVVGASIAWPDLTGGHRPRPPGGGAPAAGSPATTPRGGTRDDGTPDGHGPDGREDARHGSREEVVS